MEKTYIDGLEFTKRLLQRQVANYRSNTRFSDNQSKQRQGAKIYAMEGLITEITVEIIQTQQPDQPVLSEHPS